MAGNGIAATKQDKRSYLSDLRSPLVFFGLSLLVVESALGGCLLKYSYSEKTALFLASWMGGLFGLSILVVSLLTYKAAKNMVLESEYYAKAEKGYKDVESAQEHLLRVRNAVRRISEFSESGPKDVPGTLDLLTEVEMILLSRPTETEVQAK